MKDWRQNRDHNDKFLKEERTISQLERKIERAVTVIDNLCSFLFISIILYLRFQLNNHVYMCFVSNWQSGVKF